MQTCPNWSAYVKTDSGLFNTLPYDKILDYSKLKTLAEDKINVTQKLRFVTGWVENIVGKGENAGNQHFLLFTQSFQKFSFFRVIKSQGCVVKS